MLDYLTGTPTPIRERFTVAPSGGFLSVYAQEEVHDAWAILAGYAPSLDSPDRAEAIALVTIRHVVQIVYGYPNEEAYWKDPRGDFGSGLFEIVGSAWADNVVSYNLATFGSTYFFDGRPASRHFFLGSKDASAQFLAQDLQVEVHVGSSYQDVRTEVLRRIDTWHSSPR